MIERLNYHSLLRQRSALLKKLGNWPPVLRGSLREHKNRCGNLHCRCRRPKEPLLHGPYEYLSHRYGNRTQTILLTKAKRSHAKAWVANYKGLIQAVYELCEVNFQILRYHHNKLGPC